MRSGTKNKSSTTKLMPSGVVLPNGVVYAWMHVSTKEHLFGSLKNAGIPLTDIYAIKREYRAKAHYFGPH